MHVVIDTSPCVVRRAAHPLWMALLLSLLLSVSAVARAASASSVDTSASTVSAATQHALSAVKDWFNGSASSSELLPPDQAFQAAISAQNPDTLIARLTPADNYYLYRSRIKFSVVSPPGITIAGVSLPPGELKEDPSFGKEEVYYHPIDAVIQLKRSGVAADRVVLRTSYQGCNVPLGVCYPPIEKTFTVALTAAGSSGNAPQAPAFSAASSQKNAAAPSWSTVDPTDADGISRLFVQHGLWTVAAAFFGFGLLLAFTPCMLPMIPILSGIIVGRGQQVTHGRAFALSLVYVLAMAITYALAGVAAGLAGTLLSSYLQNAWVLGGFAAIFVLLALSMFGLYELQLPVSLQTRLAGAAGRTTGGRVVGVFLMGVLSALIVGPCVAAPLAGALLYIGQTQDVLLGGLALFSLAVGMGVPLLVIGTAAGSLLPRAGAWMTSVQRLFGVLLLAVAIYLVSPVIPALAQMLLWALLLIVSAMYLHAIDPLPAAAQGYRRFGKGIGVIALVTGVALLVGALSGSRDPLQPLAGLRNTDAAGDVKAAVPASVDSGFRPVHSVAEFEAQLQAARGRYVMLDFWAEWCVSCKEMDRFTFSDPKVQARLKDVLLLRADVTANSADDQALLKRFALFGPPGIVFFDRQGKEIGHRVIGFMDADQFISRLNQVFL